MSKYYKEEDLIKVLTGFVRETGIDETPYEYAEFVLDKIPSIEVDEDCISKRKLISDLSGIWEDGYTPNLPRTMLDFQDMLEDINYKIRNAPPITSNQK